MNNFIELEMVNSVTRGNGSTDYVYEKEWFNLAHIVSFFPPANYLYLSTGSKRCVSAKSSEHLIKRLGTKV